MKSILIEFLSKLLQGKSADVNIGTAFGGISASIHAILKFNILQVDWSLFGINLLQKLIEVSFVAVVGSTLGYITTRWLKKKLKDKS